MLNFHRFRRTTDGQALVELVLVLPLFLMILVGIIILGLGVFFQQQLTNAAREGARFASVNSATAACPTVSWLEPDILIRPKFYYRCDPPESGWPVMTARARSLIFGVPKSGIHVTACWSGYWTKTGLGAWADWDAPASAVATPTYFRPCTIGGIDPRTATASLPCPATTTVGDDMASDYAASNATSANQVTVYACYVWQPPLAGFLLIPPQITMRSVITEAMQYQQ